GFAEREVNPARAVEVREPAERGRGGQAASAGGGATHAAGAREPVDDDDGVVRREAQGAALRDAVDGDDELQTRERAQQREGLLDGGWVLDGAAEIIVDGDHSRARSERGGVERHGGAAEDGAVAPLREIADLVVDIRGSGEDGGEQAGVIALER